MAVVTHDVEFSRRRKAHVIGHHLFLRCLEEQAVELIRVHHDEIVQALTLGPDVFVQVSTDGCTIVRQWSR